MQLFCYDYTADDDVSPKLHDNVVRMVARIIVSAGCDRKIPLPPPDCFNATVVRGLISNGSCIKMVCYNIYCMLACWETRGDRRGGEVKLSIVKKWTKVIRASS